VLGLEYCGAGYCGWQSQPTGATVQDALERALSRFADAPVRVVCAGRTDTGVHASLQVVHLDTSLTRTAQSWVRGTNAHLPDDIRVCWAHALTGNLAQEFHSRFAARARTYRYLLLNDAVAPAIQHGRVGWFHAPLDAQTMHAAAQCLVGEHDFSAFRAAECQAKTPVKQLFSVEVTRRGKWVVFTITANAFLHHMVRNIVGSLVYVGAGRETGSWFADLLTQRNRRLAAPTFAPHGLYLSHIDYDPRFGLLPYISDMTARQRLPDTP
jgi:tRNA pseudouridine38-40 synthase